jgi:hypothetical protein
VACALGLSRSHLSAHREPKETRGRAVRSTDDQTLLTRIRAVTDVRATYGYRRVAALLRKTAEPVVANHKRVYRVMRDAKLLLPRHTGLPQRPHEVKVITAERHAVVQR